MLALSEDGTHWRVREENEDWSLEPGTPSVRAHWRPWPDVEIDTWLIPAGRRHLRAHRIRTGRPLHTAEGGFCVPRDEGARQETGEAGALVATGSLCSAVRDLTGTRRGEVVRPSPNGHLLWPRTLLPTLRGELEPGEHWLTTAVYADTSGQAPGLTTLPTSDLLKLLPRR